MVVTDCFQTNSDLLREFILKTPGTEILTFRQKSVNNLSRCVFLNNVINLLVILKQHQIKLPKCCMFLS